MSYLQIESAFDQCVRALSMNKLNGTIPPELGNLRLLTALYDLIVLIDNLSLIPYINNDPSQIN